MHLSSNSVTTPSIPVSAAADNRYCRTLVILVGGKDMDVCSRLNFTVPESLWCVAKLCTVPSESFHICPCNMSNRKILVYAAPTNTSTLVNFCSSGSQSEIFVVGHCFSTPLVPVNLTLRQPAVLPRVCAASCNYWHLGPGVNEKVYQYFSRSNGNGNDRVRVFIREPLNC